MARFLVRLRAIVLWAAAICALGWPAKALAQDEPAEMPPRDVSVIGFDDAPKAPSFVPGLTTIRQPLQTMSSEAMSAVVQQIETGAIALGRVFSPELIVRGSTACPPKDQ